MITMFQTDEVLDKCDIEIDTNMTRLDGKKLEPPRILDQGRSVDFKSFQDRKIPSTQPLKMGKQEWAVIYHEKDADNVTEFLN